MFHRRRHERVKRRFPCEFLTEGQRYSLSDQTKKVLAGLEDEVTITYFQREREMLRGRDRLKEPMMGRVWSFDAAWDLFAMSRYGTITSLS